MRKTHNATGTKCNYCSFICYHRIHLETHERSHIEKKYFCDVCNKGYINKRKLKHHQISHSNERPFHCTQCDLSFKARFILTKHVKTVHVSQACEVCQICGKNVRKTYLERHLKIHEERSPYPCTECNKKFSLEKSLEIHFKRVHQNEQLKYHYLCNICGRGVVSRAELKRHLNAHKGVKPFECDICGKSYGRTGALNHHKKTVHLNQRPCVCPICSQAFHSKNILQNHMRKHTGERPYSCLVCGKSFGFRCVLKTHMRVHAT
ncbi:oocyte zinc finger protein XlCOF19-like [Chrysoperla carnea]|uniref:oocyte zinc finger protein XlCOF19-like n=1 Tax=Chrysoperla carnea TaxID=189513 RepID=UPI001D06AC21|nr:oocyte zinc finger protein XlCOF19-like [Chrysoperla carnea]